MAAGEPSYIAAELHCLLVGLDGIQITLALEPDYHEIPINATFGF